MPTWEVHFGLYIDTSSPDLLRMVYEAQSLARVIQDIPLKPAAREKLNRINIVRAVRGTTAIEGSDLSEAEVQRALETPESEGDQPASRGRARVEARNAAEVMVYVAEALDKEPTMAVTEELICHMHRLTTSHISYPTNEPGHYRLHAVNAGDYVPPRTGDEVRTLMSEFVRWLNTPPTTHWHPVIRAIAAHFYFISIHPFGDGNGRTARALESFLLYQAQINQLGFYSLSNYYYLHREEYIDLLNYSRFSSRGNLTPFIEFAARGLLAELQLVRDEVIKENQIVAFKDYAEETIDSGDMHGGTKMRLKVVVYHLMQVSSAEDRFIGGRPREWPMYAGLSPKTWKRDVDWLEKHDLVVREAARIRPKFETMRRFTRPTFQVNPR